MPPTSNQIDIGLSGIPLDNLLIQKLKEIEVAKMAG
jgi:hypothetical protein